ncbi:MAG: hypothetical protein QOI85_206, partial [Chloroflexota bacterium]|nr:hypothetical protein [Chloroflexota bacterium]
MTATFLAVSLLAWPPAATPTAATDVDWSKPVPSPARGGGLKDHGPGKAAPAEPTGRLIVRFRAGTSIATRDQARREAGLTHVADVALPNSELVEPSAGGLRQAMVRLDADAAVELVEPEYRRALQGGPTTDTFFGQQWSLDNTGQVIETFAGAPDVDMNVPEAWEITTGDTDLVVAVLDDGVDFTHPDLAGRQWINPGEIAANGVDDDANGYIDDVNGWDFCNDDNTIHEGSETHGTHVSGSIAANANGFGVVGVAPSVRIMAVKIFDNGTACGTDQQAIDAIAYAADNGALIINASWGSLGASQSLGAAIEAVPDVLVVAAAGNGGTDGLGDDNDEIPFYPASYDLPNVLSVAAVHNEGQLSTFSNFGATSVDLSAPGEDVLSSVVGGSFAYGDGTSMAAANATGVAALAASATPSLLGDAPSLREHLIATAKALPSTFGWVASPRLVDARAAVVDRPDIRRLSGANRFETAAAISEATFVPFVPYLFIATGMGFPDALAGGAVAAQTGSPLLLVQQNSIPAATLAEIQRLQPWEIYVLGGTGVVSNMVLGQLDELGFNGAYRIAGANRYATAAAVSQGWTAGVPNVFIATGLSFPDALAGVPAGSVLGGPLLLTATTSLPNETKLELQRLNPARVVILGGTGVVSSSVASQIGTAAGAPVVRWAGANRFATAATVSANSFGSRAETAFVANGLGFPDALAGGPSGGAYGGPMLLTTPPSLPSQTAAELV